MPTRPDHAAVRHLAGAVASQWGALGFGLAASFLVLLATKQLGAEVRVFCALGAIVVILLWLATGGFRRDGLACAASSTLALLPIAALECGWVTVDDRGTVLMIETFCLAILFVGHMQRLGLEAVAAARLVLRQVPLRLILPPMPRSRVIVVQCCLVLLGLMIVPLTVRAAAGQIAEAAQVATSR
jgi:hypothetical protein